MKSLAAWVGRAAVVGLAVAIAAVSCTRASEEPSPGRVSRSAATSSPASTGSPSSPPSTTNRTPPGFEGTVSRIDPTTRAAMTGSSWHPGCPVRIGDLRVLHMNERGFDGNLHPGELIVNRDSASAVLGVFRELFLARFPIQRMRPVDAYGGSDARSMAADNTSGFNCRYVPGSPGVWSQHAYGHAVDINPLRNPYVTSAGNVMPPRGARFTDRSLPAPGMIRSGGVVVRAFASIGWGWGGGWNGSPDYQHFSATGSAR